uniref:Uncharacterized protein n=1 Tax=Coccolithus braarudii TaxID=221442 RepID=A0A7S0QBJ3_9EUKA|mmetsp:Transcript_7789/g.17050  ORF Transcript_7789/g.17050 Transcript_7789/m.17050 type:complete len:225 (+) Transcript_7789:327-1001(+)
MCSIMLCNAAVGNATVAFRFASSTTSALSFGECEFLTAPVGKSVAVTLAGSDGSRGEGHFVALAARGRAYAVAYRVDAELQLIAPSSAFKEVLPTGWDRFVWANLCAECGNVSAFVSGFSKQINKQDEPMTCGRAIDETEGPPGPPLGAVGVFTQYHPTAVGAPVAPICFPWARAEYDGYGEPFQMLLAPNLTMTLLWGHSPMVFTPASALVLCAEEPTRRWRR